MDTHRGGALRSFESAAEHEEILQQLYAAMDPTGETRQLLTFLDLGRGWLQAISLLPGPLGRSLQEVCSASSVARDHLELMAQGIELLGPRGWAIGRLPSAAIRDALTLLQAGEPAQADERLAEEWDQHKNPYGLNRLIARVKVLGAGDESLEPLFMQRGRLLKSAQDHHFAARYEASIPLLYAQVEGLARMFHEVTASA